MMLWLLTSIVISLSPAELREMKQELSSQALENGATGTEKKWDHYLLALDEEYKKRPTEPVLAMLKADVLISRRKFSEAEEVLRLALSAGQDPHVKWELGHVLRLRKNPKEGFAYWKQVTEEVIVKDEKLLIEYLGYAETVSNWTEAAWAARTLRDDFGFSWQWDVREKYFTSKALREETQPLEKMLEERRLVEARKDSEKTQQTQQEVNAARKDYEDARRNSRLEGEAHTESADGSLLGLYLTLGIVVAALVAFFVLGKRRK